MSERTRRTPTREEVNEILRQKRKHRSNRACLPCATRKVKCDNGHPCATCVKRDHAEICIYEDGDHGDGQSTTRRVRLTPTDSIVGLASTPAPVGGSVSPRVAGSASAHSKDAREGGSGRLTFPWLSQQSSADARSYVDDGRPQVTQRQSSNRTNAQEPPNEPGLQTQETPAGSRLRSPVDARAQSRETRAHTGESREDSFVGDNSAASFVRGQAGDDSASITREILPILGLQNTFASYPFVEAKSPADTAREFTALKPSPKDVLTYFNSYRTMVHPLRSMLVDVDEFETFVCKYLETSQEQSPRNQPSAQDIAQVGLLLAVLASGAQFLDVKGQTATNQSKAFACSSFHCLRLANFLLRPSMEVIQTLLLLGYVLQNDGQSDGAWVLLGTTVRLAQSLGLHSVRSSRIFPESIKTKRKRLWSIILWQDCNLSLCYDRPPASTLNKAAVTSTPPPGGFPYEDAMFQMTSIGLNTLSLFGTIGADIDTMMQQIITLDALLSNIALHLQAKDNCRSIQQHLEYLTFRLQMSFLASVICRPAFREPAPPGRESDHSNLINRGKSSLTDTLAAFLDLESFSSVALRSWSMVHAGLSSALLLGILGETKRNPQVRKLQQNIIDVLAPEETGAQAPSGGRFWLSNSHRKALRALRTATREEPPILALQEGPQNRLLSLTPAVNLNNGATEGGMPSESLFDFLDQDGSFSAGLPDEWPDLSPMAFFDSIITDPSVNANDQSLTFQ